MRKSKEEEGRERDRGEEEGRDILREEEGGRGVRGCKLTAACSSATATEFPEVCLFFVY